MSASDQSVVSTRYRECEFPEPARLGLISQGAKPIKAVVWERENHVAYGMFSEDPSGENGEMEKHLSVSAVWLAIMFLQENK